MIEAMNEDRRRVDIELTMLTLLLYALVFIFATYSIHPWLFFTFFYLIEARIFATYHDRMHSNNRGGSIWMEKIADYFCLFVTPWSEPYSSFKWKHFQHHKTHAFRGTDIGTYPDCHMVYQKGLIRSLLACMFYEEVQFFMDLRDHRINGERAILILTYTSGILLFIHFFGLHKFATVFLALRVSGCISWFSFSYGLHREAVYSPDFHKKIPPPLQRLTRILLGARVVNNMLYHELHHRYPSVRSRDLHQYCELHAG